MVVRARRADNGQDSGRGAEREGRLLSRRAAAPRIAITTDWLTSFGGGERCLHHLRLLYPNAPIYTSVYDPAKVPEDIRAWDIRPSILQRFPGVSAYSRALLPLMPAAFERFDLSEFDAVVSVSTAFSKNICVEDGAVNVCYCNTPPRYLWDLWDEYRRRIPASRVLSPLVGWLRSKDLAAAARVDQFIGNSNNVADRIRRNYGRESVVIYPPVDTDRVLPNGRDPEDFYLVVTRLVGYKRVDLAIEACNRLKRRLVVVGRGKELDRLRRLAGPTVTFAGGLPDADVAALYRRARAFLFPGFEDFGITPVEAQAAGRPVVAFGKGGALETVVDGVTGVFFHEQSVDAVVDAMEQLDKTEIDPSACRANAKRFDSSIFRQQISTLVESLLS